jgi:hypothetical protein
LDLRCLERNEIGSTIEQISNGCSAFTHAYMTFPKTLNTLLSTQLGAGVFPVVSRDAPNDEGPYAVRLPPRPIRHPKKGHRCS